MENGISLATVWYFSSESCSKVPSQPTDVSSLSDKALVFDTCLLAETVGPLSLLPSPLLPEAVFLANLTLLFSGLLLTCAMCGANDTHRYKCI